jgi:hypothetical protein
MANWTKIFIGTGIGAGIVAAVTYALRLKKTSAQLETVNKISIHSVTLDGITIRIDTNLKNPSSTKLKLKYPFVKIIYKDSTIGTSQSINKDITLPAYGEANINGIMIKVPIGGLFSAGVGIYKQLLNKEPIPVTIKTVSTIDLGWKKLPYESTEQKILNQKANAQKTATKKTDKKPTTKKTDSKKSNTKKTSTKTA